MIARLTRALAGLADRLLGVVCPARWVDRWTDVDVDRAVARHPAGKQLRPGDPDG